MTLPARDLSRGVGKAPRHRRRSRPAVETVRREFPAGPIDRARITRYEARIVAYEARRAVTSPTSIPRSASRHRPRPIRRRRRPSRLTFVVRRTVALAVLILAGTVLASYTSAMLAPSNV